MRELAYANTATWEDWQRAYRFGAFYIFPLTGIIEEMDRLRELHDPRSASICQAHISLSEPLPTPPTAADLDEIHHELSRIEPFDLHYGPLRHFLPYPGVTFEISPEGPFRRLRSFIHATSVFSGVPLQHEHIAPHITIAEFITPDETTALLAGLGGTVSTGSFLCDAIEYAVPNDNFQFERMLSLPLGFSP
jgi:hypothetical protein